MSTQYSCGNVVMMTEYTFDNVVMTTECSCNNGYSVLIGKKIKLLPGIDPIGRFICIKNRSCRCSLVIVQQRYSIPSMNNKWLLTEIKWESFKQYAECKIDLPYWQVVKYLVDPGSLSLFLLYLASFSSTSDDGSCSAVTPAEFTKARPDQATMCSQAEENLDVKVERYRHIHVTFFVYWTEWCVEV